MTKCESADCGAPTTTCCPDRNVSVAQPSAWPAQSVLSASDRLDHFLIRWGYKRGEHRVAPGLYALGSPSPDSPVFVTANYTLSFDALRSSLPGVDGFLLVLDTGGINVWCAAGKRTFGTDELVHRLEVTGLADIVRHRTLLVPQLGATGIAAHEVKKRSGFKVEYGPVRAADLPAYLERGGATPEMRRVRFNLWDRLVLVPVELVHTFVPMLLVAVVLGFLTGFRWGLGAAASVLAGVVLFPLLLPWLPTREFTVKGFVLGALVALPFAVGEAAQGASAGWLRLLGALAFLLAMPPVTAYLALNFTGSSTITSPSGVRREMARYIRPMAVSFALGVLLTLVVTIAHWLGG